MIFLAIIDVFYLFVYAVTAPFRLAPIVALPGSWVSSVTTANDYITSLNAFLPITSLITVLGIFLAYELGYFGMKFINWVIRKIPGVS